MLLLQSPYNDKQCRRSRCGFVTATTIVSILVISTVAVSTYSLSTELSNASGRSAQKIQATQMSEAGTNALYAQIVTAFDTNPTTPSWPTTLPSTPISHVANGANVSDGSYSAHVVNTPTAQTVSGSTTYTFVVEGDGVSPDGSVASQVRTTFTATTTGTGNGTSTYNFPSAAIVVNGSVNLSGGSSTSDPTGNHDATIEANGAISVGSGSSVDGSLLTSLGSLSLSQLLSPNSAVASLGVSVSIPSGLQILSWTQSWLSSAKGPTGNSPNGSSYTTGSYYGTTTVKAPAYYSGDLDIGSGTTTLQPDTSGTAPYILYVHGNINVSQGGTLVNNGVVVVCDGTVNVSNGANYETTAPSSSALIDLNTSNTSAVVIAGGASENVGLIYAPNGGMTLSNNVVYTGSLISGSAFASVNLSSGAKIAVSIGLASTIPIVPSTSSESFSPSTMGTYSRML